MKKKIVAYLLCMAMGISLLPMPVTQAADHDAVVYEEEKDTEKQTETETEAQTETDSTTDTPKDARTEIVFEEDQYLEMKTPDKGQTSKDAAEEIKFSTDNENCSIDSVAWYDITDTADNEKPMEDTEEFQAGHNYTVRVILKIKEDKEEAQKFGENSKAIQIKVDDGEKKGLEKKNINIEEDGKMMTLEYTFDQEEAAAKLKFLIEEAEEIEKTGEDYYTKESWDEFKKTLDAARELSVKPEEMTIKNIPKAIQVLADAKKYLIHPHKYSVNKWEWGKDNKSATVYLKCDKCGVDDLTVSAAVSEMNTKPTCTADGKTTYTASVTVNNKTYTDTRTTVIPATGHHIVVDVKKQPTKKAEGELVKHCRDCDEVTQKLALPKKEITIYIGAKTNTKSAQKAAEEITTTYNTEDYTISYAKTKNAKTYEKYFSLKDAQKSGNLKSTLTLNSKKLSQVKLGTIPLKVTVAGKTYTTKLKVKIAKPEAKTFKVTRKAITLGGIKGVRYDLKYNYKGATKVKIRVKDASGLNEKFDRDMTNPKSNSKKCYLNIKDSDLKQFGGKYKFQVVVYYGKNVSEMLTVEK